MKAAQFYEMGDDIAEILVLLIGKPSEMQEVTVSDMETYDWTYLQSQLKENVDKMFVY